MPCGTPFRFWSVFDSVGGETSSRGLVGVVIEHPKQLRLIKPKQVLSSNKQFDGAKNIGVHKAAGWCHWHQFALSPTFFWEIFLIARVSYCRPPLPCQISPIRQRHKLTNVYRVPLSADASLLQDLGERLEEVPLLARLSNLRITINYIEIKKKKVSCFMCSIDNDC